MASNDEACRFMDERAAEALNIMRAWLASSAAPHHVVRAFADLRVCDKRAGWHEGCDAASNQAAGIIDAALDRKRRG